MDHRILGNCFGCSRCPTLTAVVCCYRRRHDDLWLAQIAHPLLRVGNLSPVASPLSTGAIFLKELNVTYILKLIIPFIAEYGWLILLVTSIYVLFIAYRELFRLVFNPYYRDKE